MGGWTKGREEVSDAVRQREGESEIEGESIGEERGGGAGDEGEEKGPGCRHS